MSGEVIALLAIGATQLAVVVAVAGLLLLSQVAMWAEMREMRLGIRAMHKELGDLWGRMCRLEGFALSHDKEPA